MSPEDKEHLIRTYNLALLEMDMTRNSLRRALNSLDRLATLLREHNILDDLDGGTRPK